MESEPEAARFAFLKSQAISLTAISAGMILLVSRFLGQVPQALTNLLVIAGAFAMAFLPLIWTDEHNPSLKVYGTNAAALLLFSVLYLDLPFNIYFLRIFLICIFCFALGSNLLNGDRQIAGNYWVLSLSTFAFGAFLTWYFSEPLLWYTIQDLSKSLSWIVGMLTVQKGEFDASASGLFITIYLVLVGIFVAVLSKQEKRRWLRLFAYTVGIVVANLVFIAILQPGYSWLQNLVSIPRFQIMDLPVLLFFLDLIPLTIFLRRTELAPVTLRIFPIRTRQAIAISIFSFGMLLIVFRQQSAFSYQQSAISYERLPITYQLSAIN